MQVGICPGGTLESYLFEFEFVKAFFCPAAESVGGPEVLFTFIFGAIGLSIFVRTGSAALPAILVLLTGGAVLSTLAAPALGMATLLILVIGAGSITYAYWRFA